MVSSTVKLHVFQSECLKEAFSELDMSSEVLQIHMSPDKPFLRLSTFGNAGSTHVSIVHKDYSSMRISSGLGKSIFTSMEGLGGTVVTHLRPVSKVLGSNHN